MMGERKFVRGHMTIADGLRKTMTAEEVEAIWLSIDREKKDRAESMPTALDALRTMCTAKERMRELGWREATYCPKDGTSFAVCELGSTGIWTGFYSGKWPEGHLIYADGAGNPSGKFWKPIEQLTEQEREQMQRCAADVSAFIDRLGRSFGVAPKESP